MDVHHRPAAMNTYRFFVVDAFDRVSALHWKDCEGDAEAVRTAARLGSAGLGVEVWDIGRLVSKVPASPPYEFRQHG
jgi:hypothetical protein